MIFYTGQIDDKQKLFKDCAIDGEFDQNLYSDLHDLTKKIKELNQEHNDNMIERNTNINQILELTEVCDSLVIVRESIIKRNQECSLEVTHPNFAT